MTEDLAPAWPGGAAKRRLDLLQGISNSCFATRRAGVADTAGAVPSRRIKCGEVRSGAKRDQRSEHLGRSNGLLESLPVQPLRTCLAPQDAS